MRNNLATTKTIGIVGLGLIGGSLGLSFQKLGYRVLGLTHKPNTAIRARERGIANLVSTDQKILEECPVVILALPLSQLLKPESKLIDSLHPDAVITDVGSVKTPVLKIWEQLHPNFIASHPMAGKDLAGVDAGIANLFHGKPWIATPNERTNPKALEVVKGLAISLGCNWLTAEANAHDQAVALISHLPVLISAALLKTTNKINEKEILNLARGLASSGFADTTRVGGGNPELGLSMLKNNTSTILHFLSLYKQSLEIFEKSMMSKDWELLEEELKQTNLIRPTFLKN